MIDEITAIFSNLKCRTRQELTHDCYKMGWDIPRRGLDLVKNSKSYTQVIDFIIKTRKEERWKQQEIVMGHTFELTLKNKWCMSIRLVATDLREILFHRQYQGQGRLNVNKLTKCFQFS